MSFQTVTQFWQQVFFFFLIAGVTYEVCVGVQRTLLFVWVLAGAICGFVSVRVLKTARGTALTARRTSRKV